MASALGKAKDPIALSDAVRGLGPNWRRPRELQGFEAVAMTVEASPDAALYVVFFGKQGVASGLSKSLLFLGVYLAAQRRAAASRRPDALRALTDRERQILNLAKSGLTDAKIGKMLSIATRTVRFHLGNAMRKAGAETRAQLIAKSSQRILT
ncbi:MAG: helix-turn-helix transcriptional regulator [Micropepsaceae bacterium]